MKKQLSVILVLILCLGAFAGCSSGGSGDSAAPASSDAPVSSAPPASSDAPEAAEVWKPTAPVTIIVPYGAGGGQDVAARLLAKHAEKYVDVKFVADNRTGGSGTIGTTAIANAKPDGYTLGMYHSLSNFDQFLVEGVTYTEASFINLVAFCADTTIIVANKKLGAESIQDVVDLALASPGRITWGGPEFSAQTYPRMNVENATGAEFGKMIFDGGANTLAAVAGGNCDVTSVFPSEYFAMADNPDIVPIATCGTERIPAAPDVPTMIEQGVDATFFQIRTFVLPAGTPNEIVAGYVDLFEKVVNDPEFIKELSEAGFNPLNVVGDDAQKLMMDDFNSNKDNIIATAQGAA